MTTRNIQRANQQARSNPESNLAIDKELYSELINDAYNNKLKNIGPFRGTILAIKDKLLVTEQAWKKETQIVNGFNAANFYEVIIRPEWLNNVPAPWTMDDFKFDKTKVAIQGVSSLEAVNCHPTAKSRTPFGNGSAAISLKVGDIVLCTFGDGPNNQGKLRDIRFELNKVAEDQELVKAAGGKGAFNHFYKNQKSQITGQNGQNVPDGTAFPNPKGKHADDLSVFKGKQFDKKGYNINANDQSGFLYPGKRGTYIGTKRRTKEEVTTIVMHSTAGKTAKPGKNKAAGTVGRMARAPTKKAKWKNKNTGKTEKHPLCDTVYAVDGKIPHGHVCTEVYNEVTKKKELRLQKMTYVSIHYATDQNGNIAQGCEEAIAAQHAGTKKNKISIGIEMCGKPGEGPNEGAGGKYAKMYNEKLLDVTAKLVAGICRRWDIPLNRKNIIGHEEFSSDRFDPGTKYNKAGKRHWDWADFFKRISKYTV